MRALPAEEKAKIAVLAESLAVERSRLEREITQWDETGNDIIVLAKKMCMMMMEMSDFTRGQGPLKTTMDVIEGAKVCLIGGIGESFFTFFVSLSYAVFLIQLQK